MTWKRVGIAVAVMAALFVLWSQLLIVKQVGALVTNVAGLQRHMDVEPAPAGEAMSVTMTDDGDLRIRIKSEGKNSDPNMIDFAVLDAVTKRIRDAMPKEQGVPASPFLKKGEQPVAQEPDCGAENQLANPSRESQDNRGWTPTKRIEPQPRAYFGYPHYPTIIRPYQQPRRLEQPFYRSW